MEEPALMALAPLPVKVHLVTAASSVKPVVVHWIPATKEVYHSAGRALPSEWSVNKKLYSQRL